VTRRDLGDYHPLGLLEMKTGLLTGDELRHLEHRCAVLASFLDVSSDSVFSGASGHTKEGRIFRGCMDGAIATCRALCERFDLTLNSRQWVDELQPCDATFKADVKTAFPGAIGSDCEALWEVLVAANRCVCHLEDKLVDHKVSPQTLRNAVRLVREIVRSKLSEAHLPNTACK
jgi:hypothetical protein